MSEINFDRVESIGSESKQSNPPLMWRRANPDNLLKHINKMSDSIGKAFINELKSIETEMSKIKRLNNGIHRS